MWWIIGVVLLAIICLVRYMPARERDASEEFAAHDSIDGLRRSLELDRLYYDEQERIGLWRRMCVVRKTTVGCLILLLVVLLWHML